MEGSTASSQSPALLWSMTFTKVQKPAEQHQIFHSTETQVSTTCQPKNSACDAAYPLQTLTLHAHTMCPHSGQKAAPSELSGHQACRWTVHRGAVSSLITTLHSLCWIFSG